MNHVPSTTHVGTGAFARPAEQGSADFLSHALRGFTKWRRHPLDWAQGKSKRPCCMPSGSTGSILMETHSTLFLSAD